MVKRRSLRDRVLDAGEKEKKLEAESVVPSVAKSKHFQRKLAKRMNFNDKLKQLQDAAISKSKPVAKKRKRGLGKALGSFGGMMDCLQAVEVKTKPAVDALKMNPKTLKSRARTQLYASEVDRATAVMNHPAYKSNPVAAIRAHLEATISATEALAADPSQKKSVGRNRKRNKGKAKGDRAEVPGAGAMEP